MSQSEGFPDFDTLPTFDSSRPLLQTKAELRAVAGLSDDPTFLRVIRCTGPEDMSLRERLTTAEREYKKLKAICGIAIVQHTYGLYPLNDSQSAYMENYAYTPFVPLGYALAAEVAIVDNAPLQIPSFRLLFGVHTYRRDHGNLTDFAARQVKRGISRQAPEKGTQRYMLDIDLRLSRTTAGQNPLDDLLF